jgi:2-amino-4-hydroxy-6-hydroxymethyldihydropteridine diphosphokinase
MPEPDRSNWAYLSLGSNIDPAHNLPQAVRLLGDYGRVRRLSNVYQSPALGFAAQPDFLNAAVLLETHLSAAELRQGAIVQIEQALGRLRTENKNAPRPIDIDIMLFNRDVLALGGRRIPDSEALERPFVAIPLAEIDPDYVHPETGETLAQIAARFDIESAGMRRRDDIWSAKLLVMMDGENTTQPSRGGG